MQRGNLLPQSRSMLGSSHHTAQHASMRSPRQTKARPAHCETSIHARKAQLDRDTARWMSRMRCVSLSLQCK